MSHPVKLLESVLVLILLHKVLEMVLFLKLRIPISVAVSYLESPFSAFS